MSDAAKIRRTSRQSAVTQQPARRAPSPDQDRIEEWSGLMTSQRVSVKEPGREIYTATVDAITVNADVIWIISAGGTRRAFDAREGIRITPLEEHES